MAEGRTWLGCCCAWVLGSLRDGLQEGKQDFTGMPSSSPAALGSSPGASHHKGCACCTQHITSPKPWVGGYHRKLQCWAHTLRVQSKTEIQLLKAFCCYSSAEALVSALEKGSALLFLLSWDAPVGIQWHGHENGTALTLSLPEKKTSEHYNLKKKRRRWKRWKSIPFLCSSKLTKKSSICIAQLLLHKWRQRRKCKKKKHSKGFLYLIISFLMKNKNQEILQGILVLLNWPVNLNSSQVVLRHIFPLIVFLWSVLD